MKKVVQLNEKYIHDVVKSVIMEYHLGNLEEHKKRFKQSISDAVDVLHIIMEDKTGFDERRDFMTMMNKLLDITNEFEKLTSVL